MQRSNSPGRSPRSGSRIERPRATIERSFSGGVLRRGASVGRKLCETEQHENLIHRAGLSPPSIVPRSSPSRGSRSALSPLARHIVLNSPTSGGLSGNEMDDLELFSLDMPLVERHIDKEPQAAAAPPAAQQPPSDRDFRVVPFVVPGQAMELLKRKCASEGTAYHTLTFLFFLLALSRTLGMELSGVVRLHANPALAPRNHRVANPRPTASATLNAAPCPTNELTVSYVRRERCMIRRSRFCGRL